MNSIPQIHGFPIINLQNFSELIKTSKVGNFDKITEAIPLEEYLKTNLTTDEKKELRFAPKVEAIKFKDPRGKNFTGFRSVLKDGALIFTLLPKNFLVICAEFRHGCERVMLNLPAGVIEEKDISPKIRAKQEFEDETGIVLQKLASLNSKGIPIDARVLTRKNFFFLGIPKKPLEIKEVKLEQGEFVQKFLVKLDDWLKFMELGIVDDCSMAGTLLALRKLKIVSLDKLK